MLPYGIAASLVFEVVVTLGVAMWTRAMARGVSEYPWAWAIAVGLGSFAIHRVVELAVSTVAYADLLYTPAGKLLATFLPVAGSLMVFIVAPIAVWLALPRRETSRPGIDIESWGDPP